MLCEWPRAHEGRQKWGQKPWQGLGVRTATVPLFWRGAWPQLTCDGAVVIVPWDPGQPHAPLGQVRELQVPGSVGPPWQQGEKTPGRTPALEPAGPCAGPSPGHGPGQAPDRLRSPPAGTNPSLPGGVGSGTTSFPSGPRKDQGETPFLRMCSWCKHLENTSLFISPCL